MCVEKLSRSGIVALAVALLAQPAHAASTERVSVNSAEIQGNRQSYTGSMSADGRFVAFYSDASNLVPNDNNNETDVFVRDRLAGTTELISVSTDGVQGNDVSHDPSISADGRFVAFSSKASTLVAGDTNGSRDVFVRDRLTGETEIIPVPSGGGLFPERGSPSISGDGRLVALDSDGVESAIVVFDRQTRQMTEYAEGVSPSISADGQVLVWLCGGDVGICREELTAGAVNSAARSPSVSPTAVRRIGEHEFFRDPVVSANGRVLAYTKTDNELDSGNGFDDIYVVDRNTGVRKRISVNADGLEANGSSGSPAITPDGRFVAFHSEASDLVPGDTNGTHDVFVYDRQLRTMRRVSVDGAGRQGNAMSTSPSISANGSFVAFTSHSTNFVSNDTNNTHDVFVRARGPRPDGRNDLLVDFGARGLWQFLNNSTWVKIDSASPIGITVADLDGNFQDEAIAAFPGRGTQARHNNAGPWQKVQAPASARIVGGDFDGTGLGDLAADYGAQGLRVRVNGGAWVTVNTSADALKVGDLDGNGKDELIAKLTSGGLWARYNNAAWTKLGNASPLRIASGDLDGNGHDEVIADRGSAGLWVFSNNSIWKRLTTLVSQGLATGDLDSNGQEDLVVDFGGAGLFAYYNNSSTRVKLDSRSPERLLITDLDRDGRGDVVADFGPAGLWARYNNAGAFRQLRAWPLQAVAAGSFD